MKAIRLREIVFFELLFSFSISISIHLLGKKSPPVLYDFRETVISSKREFKIGELQLLKKIEGYGDGNFSIIKGSPSEIISSGPILCGIDPDGYPLWSAEPQYGCAFPCAPENLTLPVYKVRDETWFLVQGRSQTKHGIFILPSLRIEDFGINIKNLSYLGVFDLNRDGAPEVLISGYASSTPKKNEERYVGLFDYRKKSLVWLYKIGAGVVAAWPLDVDGDGFEELILFTVCFENGTEGFGSVDFHRGQFIVIDRFGGILYRKTYWGHFTNIAPQVVDLDQDGKKEILITHYCHYFWDGGTLELLDPDGWVSKARLEFEGESPLYPIILKNEGGIGKTVFTVTSQGRFLLLDNNLKMIKDTAYQFLKRERWDYILVLPIQTADLNGNGKKELLVKVRCLKCHYKTPRGSRCDRKRYLLLLDGNLNILKKWEDRDSGGIFDLDGDGVNELILSKEEEGFEIWGFKK